MKNIRVLSLLLLPILIPSGLTGPAGADGLATFVFGDSLVDHGNNNYIVTLSRANYPPNGIDFGRPTGRFTNGRTIVDIQGEVLSGGSLVPPYLAPTTIWPATLQGVNYASGAGGILNDTGRLFGGRISLDAQIDNFANTRQDIIARVGPDQAQNFFDKAMFAIAIGSNDFINNYLISADRLVPPEIFVTAMINRFRLQLTRLYELGARKIAVMNIGPIGCIPYQRDVNPTAGDDDCAALPNELAQLFNSKLRTLVQQLITESQTFPGLHLVHGEAFRIVSDIIANYASYGFENANSACCRVAGRHGGLIPCGPPSLVCPDRTKFVFWDPYHPSEAANLIIAGRLLDGGADDIWPMNVRQLAAI
ncbi:unnamed protein product [Linum trigynum]|uniref:GDSL esterase/lipase n=1 Tax=Linum trigynum TaxID=586398 RepID=A0AAV2FGK6_9ROSI